MKTTCVCVVLVFLLVSDGQTSSSEPVVNLTPAPVEPNSSPTESKIKPEDKTETNSTVEDLLNLDPTNQTETEDLVDPTGPTPRPTSTNSSDSSDDIDPSDYSDSSDSSDNIDPSDSTDDINNKDVSTDPQDRNTTPTTTDAKAPVAKGNSSWGFVILVLILVLVLALCVILVHMRRVSRTYAFDLQLPGPSRSVEPIGSFEPVHLDDLDYQGHTTGFSVSVEANGSVSSPEDKEPNGEVEASQSNGLQTPPAPESGPTAETEPTRDQPDQDQPDQDRPDQDQPDLEDLSSSPVLFIEESEEEMNSNNNNQLSLSGPFEEINLDETRSSVQPFGFSSAELQPFY